ncbi:MAG: hypothetical protein LBU61_06470 [Coriobacteriales bacterium]|nr:hypothetical protein [Coriobacteriales bacterium]
MDEIIKFLTKTPLGVVTVICLLMALCLAFAAFYERKTRRLYPDSSKKRKKR